MTENSQSSWGLVLSHIKAAQRKAIHSMEAEAQAPILFLCLPSCIVSTFKPSTATLSSKRRKSRMEGMFPSIKSTSQKSPTSLPFTSHGPELRYPATSSHNRGRTIPTSLVAATHQLKTRDFIIRRKGTTSCSLTWVWVFCFQNVFSLLAKTDSRLKMFHLSEILWALCRGD